MAMVSVMGVIVTVSMVVCGMIVVVFLVRMIIVFFVFVDRQSLQHQRRSTNFTTGVSIF